MKRIVLAAALAALALPAAADKPASSPHPHFNDQGTLTWFTALADAKAAAKKGGRAIFVEYGRAA
jgi:ABC-type sugar transport system substrate-binding protein